jgi:hypothetical protein
MFATPEAGVDRPAQAGDNQAFLPEAVRLHYDAAGSPKRSEVPIFVIKQGRSLLLNSSGTEHFR